MITETKIKSQVRQFVEEMNTQGKPAKYQDALELFAKVHGHRNWKTFSASLSAQSSQQQPQDAQNQAQTSDQMPSFTVGGKSYKQTHIPGDGALFRVPVSVDTSATALVLVRALDSEQAIETARELVSQGGAIPELDDGNYRGKADYYCPDASEDSVFVVEHCDGITQEGLAQAGHFRVETFELNAQEEMLWADLTVLSHELRAEGDAYTAMTCLGSDVSPVEQTQFCMNAVRLLNELIPEPEQATQREIEGLFHSLVQSIGEPSQVEKLRQQYAAKRPSEMNNK